MLICDLESMLTSNLSRSRAIQPSNLSSGEPIQLRTYIFEKAKGKRRSMLKQCRFYFGTILTIEGKTRWEPFREVRKKIQEFSNLRSIFVRWMLFSTWFEEKRRSEKSKVSLRFTNAYLDSNTTFGKRNPNEGR